MPSSASVTLRSASATEAAALSALALRSKAHWGYSEEFMRACEGELSWRADEIRDAAFSFIVAEAQSSIAGFYACKQLSAAVYELEALFVEPKYIGRGVGRRLIEHAIQALQQRGAATLSIQGDPNAESFYLAAGGSQVGSRPSGSIAGRTLPLFEINLNDRKLKKIVPEQP